MKANKKPSAFRLWLGRVVPIALISALSIAASCDKPDDPTPPTPTPEPQPTEPTKTIIIDWDWNENIGWAPSKDSIMGYTEQPDVKNVYINLMNKVYPELTVTGCVCDGFPARGFHTARDTLQTRFDISDKVKGSGTIFVNGDGGAQLPDLEHGLGMAEDDSIWFASKGFTIERRGGRKSK